MSLPSLPCVIDRASALLAHPRFDEDRRWLSDRKAQWESSLWRVGLIGITSSGKSTLINAILGERLLPARVGPSSNTLIVCTRGPARHAVVHYNDGNAERLTADLPGRLAALGDEAHNRGNECNVREIHVWSPGFRLRRDICLVDSPGLDAFGLPEHERVTLKMLLPTLDMAVYVTTAMPSADRQVAECLDEIRAADKPLVVVQNMIDSVRYKPGPHGSVDRTREEVVQDHRIRMQRVVGDPGVPIVQLSAIAALAAGQWESSGMSELTRLIEQSVDRMTPRLEAGRGRQLATHLQRVVEQEEAENDDAERALRAELARCDQAAEQLAAIRRRANEAVHELHARAEARANQLLYEAKNLSRRDVAGAESVATRVNALQRDVPKQLLRVIDEAQKSSDSLATGLNLQTEDLELSHIGRSQTETRVDVATYSVPGTPRKKSGFWNKVRRAFHLGGYTVSPTECVDLDTLVLHRRWPVNSV